MGLSLMMTTASTLMAIVMTPLLTLQLVGTLVPVNPKAMFLSVLQVLPGHPLGVWGGRHDTVMHSTCS